VIDQLRGRMLAHFINDPEFLELIPPIEEGDPERLPAGAVLVLQMVNAEGTDFVVTIATAGMSYFERLGLLTSAANYCLNEWDDD